MRHPPAPSSLLRAVLGASLLVAACAGGSPEPSASAAGLSPSAPAATSSPEAPPTPVAYPLTLTDDEGTAVMIPAAPRRIVSLTPATTEILFAIGLGPDLVGRTNADDYPPAATQVPTVATSAGVDVEKIVGLDPDLVIAGGNNFNSPDAIARLRSLGIPVVVVYAATVQGVLDDIRLVGRSAGANVEATALATSMATQFDAVRAATERLERPLVFYEIDATSKIYTAADDSFIAQMISLAGGRPVTSGSATSYEIPLERIITANPSIIVLGDAIYGVTADQVAARPGWGSIEAVRAGAIRPVDDIVVTRPGPRLVQGLLALVRAIHPELGLAPSPGVAPSPSAAP